MEIKKIWRDIRSSVQAKPLAFFSLCAFLLVLALSIIFFYNAPREHKVLGKITRTFPYPIVWVNAEPITERELAENMDSVRRFYENQDFSDLGLRVDFTTEEGQKRLKVREREVLNKMVEDLSFKAIAEKRGITLSEEEVKQDIKNRIDAYGTGAEVERNLSTLYDWSVKDFAEKVVTPALYQERLEAIFEKEVDQSQAKNKIENAERELAGANFQDVARKYSEGSANQNGGSLGWFQLTDLAPELQSTVQNAPIGQPSAIVESSLGYHIILVEETKNENDIMLYRLSQVFTRKTSFSTWLTSEMQNLNILVWSPFYSWNEGQAQVDFQDESWQQFEQSVYENSAQDALFVN